MVAGAGHGFAFVIDVSVLVADAVHRADVDSVSDGVGALDSLPCVVLALAELSLLAGMPTDSGREEEDLGSTESCEAGAFGVPLVPADEGANGALGGLGGFEAEVAGGEVELFVVERVVGDVHLAVDGGDVVGALAGVVENGGGVVVEAGGAALEEAGDDYERVFADEFTERSGGGAGDGFGDGEERVIFALAEILCAEEFGQADEFCAGLCGFAHASDCLGEIGLGGGLAGHLDERDFCRLG